MSYRDSLTGLYNRNKYIDVIEGSIGKRMFNTGIAYMDLNKLKKFNDEQGHEAGDEFVIIEEEIEEKQFQEKIV